MRNLVEILRVVGLRAEDALHLQEDCLDWDAVGDPRLRWYNHKMKREGRPLPVTNEVADAIKRQRELVKDVPDHFSARYLFRTDYGLYKFESLQLKMLKSPASKNESERLKSKSDHLKKRTNCSMES